MKGRKLIKLVEQDPDVLITNIGLRLRKVRKELGYTNSDDFSYDKGINRSQYGKYEAGSQDMRISTLLRIINSMGLTFEEFFKETLDSESE